MRIAVASSGLGHVARGIETWARDTATALAARGEAVTLFSGGELPAGEGPAAVVLRGLRRFDARTQRLARWTPGPAWRWGLKDGYGWEQFAFWLKLREHLRRGQFDILHVQDPLVAAWCRRWRERGWLATREILAHGTEEPPNVLAPFPFVQHLAPWHLAQTLAALAQAGDTRPRPLWTALPNFVDTACFRPAADAAARAAARTRFGIPPGALAVGCVAAVKHDHKRIDYLIREFAHFAQSAQGRGAHLVIAGARQPDSPALVTLAHTLAPQQIQVRFDIARADMPEFYRALDVFALASRFEMMPIALLEALASGLPALVHRHPVLEWIIGAESAAGDHGGRALNMGADRALSGALSELSAGWLTRTGAAARRHAEARFGREAVIDQYRAYYRDVAAASGDKLPALP